MPAHTGPLGLATMLIVGTKTAFTVIVILLLVAIAGLAQVAFTCQLAGNNIAIYKAVIAIGILVTAYHNVILLPNICWIGATVCYRCCKGYWRAGTYRPIRISYYSLPQAPVPGFTVIVMPVLVTVAGAAHVALLPSVQVITLPLVKPLSVYVLLLPPTVTLSFFQVYMGEGPPFVIVAVNVTGVPAQIGPAGLAAIAIVGTSTALTVIVYTVACKCRWVSTGSITC